jgi:hypothetical protein
MTENTLRRNLKQKLQKYWLSFDCSQIVPSYTHPTVLSQPPNDIRRPVVITLTDEAHSHADLIGSVVMPVQRNDGDLSLLWSLLGWLHS